jgi:hypothetical protein
VILTTVYTLKLLTLRKDQGPYEHRHNDTDADIVMLIIKTKKEVSLTSVNRY